ncbi:MAG: biopolymer transporter ExbD [Pyrinomonadaceae bacterium]|nr:biopolymer transporter ExbD [Pyrinomonadaceae bacterium]
MARPTINVTPLIDVLLVLLIIFMVVTPIRPSGFKAKVPAERRDRGEVLPHPDTLVVIVDRNGSLVLNKESGLGTIDEPSLLAGRLREIFDARIANGSLSESHADDADRPYSDRIERTVFIKAPKSLEYGKVARVVDLVKASGAFPIALQIDDLDTR